jgi:HEAT repeat protein
MKTFPADIQELINTIYRGTNQRNIAFEKLTARKDADSTRALFRLLEDYRVPPFYVATIDELAQRGELDPIPHFRNILLSDSTSKTHVGNQMTVLDTLSFYRDRSATIPLVTYTLKHHTNPYILRQCVYTLGQIGSEDAIYVLLCLIQQHEDSRIRHDAIMALGSSRNSRAVDVLLNYLEYEATLTLEGEMNTDGVNAINSLLRLWKAEVQPFNLARWLQVLTNWLYSDTSEYPKSLYTLRTLAIPQAEAIIRCWEQSILREERFFC